MDRSINSLLVNLPLSVKACFLIKAIYRIQCPSSHALIFCASNALRIVLMSSGSLLATFENSPVCLWNSSKVHCS